MIVGSAATLAVRWSYPARENWSIIFQLEKPAGYSLISEKVFQKTLHGGNFFLALDGRGLKPAPYPDTGVTVKPSLFSAMEMIPSGISKTSVTSFKNRLDHRRVMFFDDAELLG